MHDIGKKMAKGAAWMVSFKLLDRGIGLISTIILARLLVPADFGLVAMATSIIALLELLGAFNFDIALIQNSQTNRHHYDTVWTFNLLFGISCVLVLLILAAPAARFYHEPRLEMVIYVLAISNIVQGLSNVGVVNFRKDMQFRKEFNLLLAKRLAASSLTVSLALVYRSYWALVSGILFGRVAEVVISYVVHPYRPRLSLVAAKELFHFSKWLLINNIIYFFNNRSADFIVGKIAGIQALGIYTVSYEISNLPTTELIAPINRAIFPGYAKMAGDLEVLRQGFLNVISAIALLALPAGVGIVATSDLLIQVLLGPKWMNAIPTIQILGIYGIIMALQTNSGYIYLALGVPRIITLQWGLYLLILVPMLIWLTSQLSVIGAAWAFLISINLITPFTIFNVLSQLHCHWSALFAVIWRPILATLIMYACVIEFKSVWHFNIYLGLIIAILIGLGVYSAAVLTLWWLESCPDGIERFLLNQVSLKTIND